MFDNLSDDQRSVCSSVCQSFLYEFSSDIITLKFFARVKTLFCWMKILNTVVCFSVLSFVGAGGYCSPDGLHHAGKSRGGCHHQVSPTGCLQRDPQLVQEVVQTES